MGWDEVFDERLPLLLRDLPHRRAQRRAGRPRLRARADRDRLAARGARVVGLHASERFPELARADAAVRGADVEYVHGDSDARRALRDGGRLLINVNNLPALLREPRGSERGDDLMLDRSTFDVARSVMRTRRTVVRSGNTRSFDFEVRMFAFPELRDWLLAAGFTSVLGVDGRGEELTLESYRMNVSATR